MVSKENQKQKKAMGTDKRGIREVAEWKEKKLKTKQVKRSLKYPHSPVPGVRYQKPPY
jgi:hypothetical protein